MKNPKNSRAPNFREIRTLAKIKCSRKLSVIQYEEFSDPFLESPSLYSANGKFMKIASNSAIIIKNPPKFMDSICGTVVDYIVKESV